MKRVQLKKIPFINVCATCGFSPVGLAQMAGVSKWVVYALLDQQPVKCKAALAVLGVLNDFNPVKKIITYSLENVDIMLEPEKSEAYKQEETEYTD